MKTIQKLEFLTGIATFLSAFLFIYYIDYPMFKEVAELHDEPFKYDWVRTFLILIFPSFLIAISSYFHAFKKSYVALAIILTLGAARILLLLLTLLIGSAFENYVFIRVSPTIFSFLTILFALMNTFSDFKAKRSLA
jgi:hypothetical protein